MAWSGLVSTVTLAVLAVLAIAVAVVAGRRAKPQPRAMGFWGHVAELRQRILRVAAVFLVGLVFALVVHVDTAGPYPRPSLSVYDPLAGQFFAALAQHLVPPGVQLVTLSPLDAFSAQFSMGLAIAITLAIPTALAELGAFLAPGLAGREKRLLGLAIIPAMVLFLLGAVFAYFFILPITLDALYAFGQPLGAMPLLPVGELSSFTLAFLVGVGLAFQAPLLMALVSRLGLVEPATFARKWKHAVLVILFVAMVVTPDPTIISQLLLGLPLIALYGLGILLAYRAKKAHAAAQAKA